MKLKGINPIEQHLEKIVLGVVALVFLGVLAFQFLINPNLVEVGKGEKVPPAKIYGVLADRANELKAQIDETDPTLPDVVRADLLDAYVEGFEQPVAPEPALAAALGAQNAVAALEGGTLGGTTIGDKIAPLAVPALTEPLAYAQWVTVDPYTMPSRPALASRVPSGQPYDLAGVSVQGTLDGAALRTVLTTAPEGLRPIPRKLWQGAQLAILGVEVERQAMGPDGQWGPATPVAPSAREPSPLAELSPEPDADVFAATVRDASQSLEAIAQPGYVPQISGEPWLNPSESRARLVRLANASEADRLLAQIARTEQDISDLRSGRTTRTTARRPSSRSSGSSSSGAQDPRSAGGSTGSRPTPTRPTPTPATNTSNERQITAKENQIERWREQLRQLGYDDKQDTATRSSSSSSSNVSRDVPRLLEEEALPVWAHDLTVVPGTTYRYRIRAVLNNPLYRREAVLDPDDPAQQALAADPLAHGTWSDWTEPVVVPDRTYLFVTSASESDQIGGGARVSGELYTMYYGYYRLVPISLEPGDAVHGTADLPDTLAIFNPASVPVDVADKTIADITAWSKADKATRAQFPTLPDGVNAAPEAVEAGLDLALVDVAVLPISATSGTAGRPSIEAVFRGPNGSLVVRTAGEGAGDLYARVSSSADRGELAMMERITDDGTKRARQTDPYSTNIDPRDPGYIDPRDPNYDPRRVPPGRVIPP